jgi:hypothetical protein
MFLSKTLGEIVLNKICSTQETALKDCISEAQILSIKGRLIADSWPAYLYQYWLPLIYHATRCLISVEPLMDCTKD